MEGETRGRKRLYKEPISTAFTGEWRRSFTRDWEEATALLRRISYRQRHLTCVSDSIYLK